MAKETKKIIKTKESKIAEKKGIQKPKEVFAPKHSDLIKNLDVVLKRYYGSKKKSDNCILQYTIDELLDFYVEKFSSLKNMNYSTHGEISAFEMEKILGK
jgi:hypothetical protein